MQEYRIGQRGMLWDRFLEVVTQDNAKVPSDILLVHLGGNNLAKRTGKLLIIQVIEDFQAIKSKVNMVKYSTKNYMASRL